MFSQLSIINSRTLASRRYDSAASVLKEWTSFLPESAKLAQRLWHIHNNVAEIPKCPMCDKLTRWTTAANRETSKARYTKHCSNRCRALDPSVEAKRATTCIERHGEDKSLSNKNHMDKTRATSLKNNGVMFPLQNESIRQRTIDTLTERFGDDAMSVIRQRGQRALKEKYGDVPFGHMFATDQFRNKASVTKREWWLPARLDEFRQQHVELVSDVNTHQNNRTMLDWKCTKCDTIFKSQIRDGLTPRCPTCFPFNRINWKQQEVIQYVESLLSDGDELICGSRQIIPPKEIDLYVASKSVAIEYNGLYWHSDLMLTRDPQWYHYNKTIACEEQNIRLLHIFDDEWQQRRPIVESIIRSTLKIPASTVIHARKCTVIPLTAKDCNAFLENNHIQGADNASVRYGLSHDGVLVGVMTFGRSRFDRAVEWECYRLAFKTNVAVTGGAARLFKRFIKEHSPQVVISYSDRRLFSGEIYNSLGFEFVGHTTPAYFYVDLAGGCNTRYNRQKFQKHKLADLLENFDPDLSESENMRAHGYGRIWDCGHKKWIWNKEKAA